VTDKRQKNQLMLAFMAEDKGEALGTAEEGTEALTAKRGTESPAIGEQLMEEVCGQETASRHWHESGPTKGALVWMG